MLDRLTELGLFLAPFVVVALLWLGAVRGWALVWGMAAFVALVAVAVWFVALQRLPAGIAYRPAVIERGRVVLPGGR